MTESTDQVRSHNRRIGGLYISVDERGSMSTATKITLGTVAVALVLSIGLILNVMAL